MSTITEKLTESKNAFEALLTFANAKTGKADTNLGDAVKTLADGYGAGQITMGKWENDGNFIIDVGREDFTSFLIMASVFQRDNISPVRSMRFRYKNFVTGDAMCYFRSSGATSEAVSISAADDLLVKVGSAVELINKGSSSSGTFTEGYEYTWLAW